MESQNDYMDLSDHAPEVEQDKEDKVVEQPGKDLGIFEGMDMKPMEMDFGFAGLDSNSTGLDLDL